MSIKQRNGVYHCDFFTPSGKRIRQSLGTTDKRQAKELHDKLKAEMWRTEKLGEAPVKLFEEACLRWLNEKSHKRSLDADKSKIGFFLLHFRGVPIGEITNDRIQAALSKMENRSHRARWEKQRDRLMREGKPVHDLRHTWASWLVQSGVPISALQEMGGWESVEMVRRYAHLSPNHLTEHAKQIDVVFGVYGTNTTQGEMAELKEVM